MTTVKTPTKIYAFTVRDLQDGRKQFVEADKNLTKVRQRRNFLGQTHFVSDIVTMVPNA